MILLKELGKNIRKFRENKGLAQEELAEKADVHVSTISRLETGVFCPKLPTLEKITSALEINLAQAFINISDNSDSKQNLLNTLSLTAERLTPKEIEYFIKSINL